MSRLTNSQRDALRSRLLKAMLPDRREELDKLNERAFDAVARDFYGTAGLKRIATLPVEWLTETGSAYVVVPPSEAEGAGGEGYLNGTKRHLPREIPNRYMPKTSAARAAVRLFFTTRVEAQRQQEALTYEIETVLNASATLEAVLKRIPAARGILSLPPAATVEETAASLNKRLASATGKKGA